MFIKLLLPILITSFLISGCAVSTSNTKSLSDNELFIKKQECFSYKGNVEKEIEDKKFPDFIEFSVKEIFYSPILNTCVSHIEYSNNAVTSIDQLKDILSGKIIDTFRPEYGNEKEAEFLNLTINYLKGINKEQPLHDDSLNDFFSIHGKAQRTL